MKVSDECLSPANKHSTSIMRKMRKARGMTLEQMADVIGVTTKTIQRYEARERVLELSVMRKLAPVLDCRVVDFLPPSDFTKGKPS